MRLFLLLATLSACGRIGFPVPDDSNAATDTTIADVAMPDAAVLLDTFTVPVDGTTATSAIILVAGLHYALVASGTFTAVPPAVDPLADAEYYDMTDPIDGPKDIDTSSMIDFGLAIDQSTAVATKTVHWGAYRSDHIYTVDYVGTGTAITATLFDCCYNDNAGSLLLQIYR